MFMITIFLLIYIFYFGCLGNRVLRINIHLFHIMSELCYYIREKVIICQVINLPRNCYKSIEFFRKKLGFLFENKKILDLNKKKVSFFVDFDLKNK